MPASTVSGRKPRLFRSWSCARLELRANQSFSLLAIASLYALVVVPDVPTSTSRSPSVALAQKSWWSSDSQPAAKRTAPAMISIAWS